MSDVERKVGIVCLPHEGSPQHGKCIVKLVNGCDELV